MKTVNSVFSTLLGAAGGICLVGGFNGHKHQFSLAIICGIMALALIIDTISIKKAQKK